MKDKTNLIIKLLGEADTDILKALKLLEDYIKNEAKKNRHTI